MKLVLDKPVTVAQGLTLEEADWGPWQFPQLLKREDGVLFASINLGPDNWEIIRRHSVVQILRQRSDVDGQQSVRSRHRLPESQKRRRLYGEGQRLHRH